MSTQMQQEEVVTGLDYAGGNIRQLFSKIFFPTLFGFMFNAMITIVDGIFVGQSVGPNGIAAVNIIAPLYLVITGFGLMFGIGCSVVSGIAIAQGKTREASRYMTQAYVASGIMIAVLVLFLTFFPQTTVRLLGCSELLMPHATNYLLWLLPGLFLLLFESIGMSVIRLDGSPKYAMLCIVIPAIINVGLDWWFIPVLGMGTKGAALASSLSIFLGASMVTVYFVRFSYVLKFCRGWENFFSNVWRQMRIGSSAMVSELAISVGMFTGNYVFMRYHQESGVAAFSIACYLLPLIFMMSMAVAQSAQPIISFNHGARAWQRVRQAFRVSVFVALAGGGLFFLIIALFAKFIVSLFIDPSCEAGLLATSGLPIYALSALFSALNIAFIGYYQSVEKAARAMVFTLLRGIVFLVPLFLIMPMLWHGKGIWAANPLAEALTLLLIVLTYLWRINSSRGKVRNKQTTDHPHTQTA